jgi:tetratricopeptide (TPR) repeat protein
MMPTCISGRVAFWGGIIAVVLTLALPADAGTVSKGTATDSESSDPNYWFQKGALCATYGSHSAAIRWFSKAIALNPDHSGAYFSRGVAYGQLGNYDRAVADINRALQMEPRNGLYYYGRGRTYLLAGEKDRAFQDFRSAASLGDEDAQAYLNGLK